MTELVSINRDGKSIINISEDNYISLGISSDEFSAALIAEAWRLVRQKRDALLLATDYAIMPDYPLADAEKTEVTAYRQALRDIPETFDSPDTVEWPTKPEVLSQ